MSSFDELADEMSDEEWDAAWAAYTSGADPLAGGATLRGFAELPIGTVEIRGDDIGLTSVFPAARLGVGEADLTDPDAVIDVSGQGPVNWSLTSRRSGVTESGTCDRVEDVTPALLEALVRLDEDNVYLDMQMVDNGRLGVGIVDATGDLDRHADPALWLATEWVLLSEDLVVLRPGSRTVTALRLVDARSGGQQLRVERSTVDVFVFVRPTGLDEYDDREHDAEEFDTVRALFERVRLGRRSLSFEEVSLVTAVIREVVAGALSLPVSKADLDDVPMGLSQLAREDRLARVDPTGSPRREWRDRVAELLAPMAHVASNTSSSVRSTGHAVLIGPALDVIDRGVFDHGVFDHGPLGDPSGLPTVLEFLVDPDDRDDFEADLLRAGFEQLAVSVTNRDLGSTSQRSFRVPQERDPAGLTIVTTSTVGTGLFAGLLDLDDFFTMSIPIRVGSAWIRGLGPSHRFILACIRFSSGADEATSRAMVLNNMPWNRVSAERVVRLADRCGALTPVRNTIRELWRTVPDVLRPVLEELVG